jgi:biotin-dependent carboxylase-like uncharacterized protein
VSAAAVPGLEVLTPGLLNTVQDLGRFGHRRFGVGTAGAMDTLALRVGNLLLGNPEDAAGIEVQVYPFALRIAADMDIAVTGADCQARLDDIVLPPSWTTRARSGQILRLDSPTVGARSYVTVAGGIAVPVVLGSHSTNLRGGFGGQQGRALLAGDILPVCPLDQSQPKRPPISLGAVPPGLILPAVNRDVPPAAGSGAELTVRVLRAGEYDRFNDASQQRFWTTAWRITAQSDRVAFRLGGPGLTLLEPIEMRSHGVMPGVVQVPPAGEPIIQMSDANTAGGYPKIAGVIEADLWRLGQARMGSRVRFIEVGYADAVAAVDEVRRYLDHIARTVSLQREAAGRIAGHSRKA